MGDLNVNFTLVEQDAGHLFPKVKTRLKKQTQLQAILLE